MDSTSELKRKSIQINPYFGIGLIWLFHLTAIIGIGLGEINWFIEKTPLNLLLQISLLFSIFPIAKRREYLLFFLFFILGFGVEYIGVQYGVPFGDYSYGENLGIKISDVPLLIGFNWALLIFVTVGISNYIKKSILVKSLIGASLMLILDVPMEIVAPKVNFWSFWEEVPLSNYVSWFLISFVMQLIGHRFLLKGNRLFSLHLYVSQLCFFIYLVLALH